MGASFSGPGCCWFVLVALVVVPSCRDAVGTLLVLLYMYDGRWGSATSPEPRARVSGAYRYSSIPAAIEWRYVGDGRARSNGGGAASHPSVRPSVPFRPVYRNRPLGLQRAGRGGPRQRQQGRWPRACVTATPPGTFWRQPTRPERRGRPS